MVSIVNKNIFTLGILFALCLVSYVHSQKEDLYQSLNNKLDNAFNSELASSNMGPTSTQNAGSSVDLNQNIFSANECFEICSSKVTSLAKYCNCHKIERNFLNCQVLCFIGQGGKACNCNYAPFVGKRR